MPLVDIYLRRGRTPEDLTTIADSVHEALVDEFGVPQEDRFQVIHQREPYELIYDKAFLGGPRTDEFVMARVIVGKERPPDVKLRLYAAIAANLSQRVGISVADVRPQSTRGRATPKPGWPRISAGWSLRHSIVSTKRWQGGCRSPGSAP